MFNVKTGNRKTLDLKCNDLELVKVMPHSTRLQVCTKRPVRGQLRQSVSKNEWQNVKVDEAKKHIYWAIMRGTERKKASLF